LATIRNADQILVLKEAGFIPSPMGDSATIGGLENKKSIKYLEK
jgi:hypothetical protein